MLKKFRKIAFIIVAAAAFGLGVMEKTGFHHGSLVRLYASLTGEKSNSVSGGLEVPRWVKDHDNSGYILERYAYTVSYNSDTRCPNWVGWVLTKEHTDGEHDRKGILFFEDMDVPRPRACYADIRELLTGYQRGHICPAGDNKWSRTALRESFLMTNICPQAGDLNEGNWRDIEIACREWAKKLGKVYITSGPVFLSDNPKRIGQNQIAVPDAFFKVVLYMPDDASEARCIGFICKNKAGRRNIKSYACTVDEVEKITGLDFFFSLDDGVEDRIEAERDFGFWFEGGGKNSGGFAGKIVI